MNSTCSWFQQRRFLVREILDLVKFLLMTKCNIKPYLRYKWSARLLYDVFGESTIKGDSPSIEVLTQERIATSTIKTVVALSFGVST